MQAPASPNDQAFLVRVNGTQYLFEITDTDVTGTTILSAAAHFTYFDADQMCQRLRRDGHCVAVVCNVFGDPVSADELRGIQEPVKPHPATHEDFELMSRILTEDPKAVAKELGIGVPDLLAKIDEANERFQVSIDALSESTQSLRDLTTANREEFDGRKINQISRSK